MAAEVEHASWIGAAIKAMGVALTAAFGWVWSTSHKQALLEQRMQSMESRGRRIEKGVGRILNHLTGTNLHDIEDD